MSHYRIGYCPQCELQIMVQDTDGKWRPKPAVYANVDLKFEDGHRVRSAICRKCAESPDYGKLMAAIFHQDSQACNEKIKEHLKYRRIQKDIDEPFETELTADDGTKKNFKGVRRVKQNFKIPRGNFVSHQVRK